MHRRPDNHQRHRFGLGYINTREIVAAFDKTDPSHPRGMASHAKHIAVETRERRSTIDRSKRARLSAVLDQQKRGNTIMLGGSAAIERSAAMTRDSR